jgi:hypothetical protein
MRLLFSLLRRHRRLLLLLLQNWALRSAGSDTLNKKEEIKKIEVSEK